MIAVVSEKMFSFSNLKTFKSGHHSYFCSAGERLTGTEITICDKFEISCHKCGVTSAVNTGDWSLVKCEAGAKGTVVKFLTPKNYFQACEIEIYGSSAEEGKTFLVPSSLFKVSVGFRNANSEGKLIFSNFKTSHN